MKKLFAIAALSAGLGALSIPASANEYYSGGSAYTQGETYAYAPAGEFVGRDWIAEDDAVPAREYLFERKDATHFQH